MTNGKVTFSLRYKLLILLTIIPIVVLALYLVMATSLFKTDKLAYVYESSVSVASSLGTQVKLEMEAFLEKAKPIVEEYNETEKDFSAVSKDMFARQSRIHLLALFQSRNGNEYLKLGQLSLNTGFELPLLRDSALMDQIKAHTTLNGLILQVYSVTGKHLLVGYRLGSSRDPNHRVMIALLEADDLLATFDKSTLYKSFLLNTKGEISIGPSSLGDIGLKADELGPLFAKLVQTELPRGTIEEATPSGRRILVSYSDPRVGGMLLASVVDKNAALEAVDILVAKSLLFFVALISATVLISVFTSTSLTSTLRELYEATLHIAQGHFDVRIKSRSRDEVGGLAESFNWMAGEVSRLLNETAEKARMENELATVKTVQETLFPPNESKFGPVHIVGHFEPASECGGDWWSYNRVGDKVFLWIGDATGHGAPAALITSAAKSASAIIESLPNMSPGSALEIMNRAIYETSKARIMMTFFLGVIDLKTGVLTYANASHDPPYLIRRGQEPVSRKDLIPLMDVRGPRLGDKIDSKYEETKVDLKRGDTLVFYTDGALDVKNGEGKAWGERGFIKSIVDSVRSNASVDSKMEHFRRSLDDYRQASALVDDVTLVMCQYEESA